MRSACTTERPGASSDLIVSRIERSRGAVWHYGDCSLEQRSGSSSPGLMKGLREADDGEGRLGGSSDVLWRVPSVRIGVRPIAGLAASFLVRSAKSWRPGARGDGCWSIAMRTCAARS